MTTVFVLSKQQTRLLALLCLSCPADPSCSVRSAVDAISDPPAVLTNYLCCPRCLSSTVSCTQFVVTMFRILIVQSLWCAWSVFSKCEQYGFVEGWSALSLTYGVAHTICVTLFRILIVQSLWYAWSVFSNCEQYGFVAGCCDSFQATFEV